MDRCSQEGKGEYRNPNKANVFYGQSVLLNENGISQYINVVRTQYVKEKTGNTATK